MIDQALMTTHPRLRNVMAHHTSPEDAGRIFSQAGVRLAAYSHFVIFHEGEGVDASADAEIERLTRTTYQGPLAFGHDLMSFSIGPVITVTNADGTPLLQVPPRS
jgi:ribonuclease Z